MNSDNCVDVRHALGSWGGPVGGYGDNSGKGGASAAFGQRIAEKMAQRTGDSASEPERLGKRFSAYRWKPGCFQMGRKREGYWKRREERRKKLRKLYQQKLEKEALARRLAQERYDAEISASNAMRSRLLWSDGKEGSVEQVSRGAIDHEAHVIAQTMLSSLFRK